MVYSDQGYAINLFDTKTGKEACNIYRKNGQLSVDFLATGCHCLQALCVQSTMGVSRDIGLTKTLTKDSMVQ